MTVTHNGRNVYKQSDGANYLYYWPNYKAWRVGLDYTKAPAGIVSVIGEAAVCPSLATEWHEWIGGGKYIILQTLQVTCAGGQYAPHHLTRPPSVYIYVRACNLAL